MADEPEVMARVWAQWARRFKLPRAAATALITAVRNGAEPDWFQGERGVHVFVHCPEDFHGAVVGEGLANAGFTRDEETGAWEIVVGS